MTSIMITNKCNNNCVYCFANNTRFDTPDFISLEDFKTALSFIASSYNFVGLIGGEPTLHPEFDKILDIVIHNEKIDSAVLYTNGHNIIKYLELLKNEKFTILINCNSPDNIGYDSFNTLKNNIIECSKILEPSKYRLGINLYKPNQNLDFFIDLLNITKQNSIRFSVVVPLYINNTGILNFHNSLKDTMISFFKQLYKMNVFPHFDCNSFPNCLLTENDKNLFKKIIDKAKKQDIGLNLLSNKNVCNPQIVIKTDLSAVRCLVSKSYQKTNISNFKNAGELYKYFYLNIDCFKNIIFPVSKCLSCPDRLINCNVCTGYYTKEINEIKQYCLEEAGVLE